jgi:hypothetical protein
MASGGKRKGAGRKPRADRSKVKTEIFAGQRWEPAKVEAWKNFIHAHGLTIKKFTQQAFSSYEKACEIAAEMREVEPFPQDDAYLNGRYDAAIEIAALDIDENAIIKKEGEVKGENYDCEI